MENVKYFYYKSTLLHFFFMHDIARNVSDIISMAINDFADSYAWNTFWYEVKFSFKFFYGSCICLELDMN